MSTGSAGQYAAAVVNISADRRDDGRYDHYIYPEWRAKLPVPNIPAA
jgi:hypothetical protein